jgi:hypothetical protein
MALNARQTRLYTHEVAVYRAKRLLGTGGKDGDVGAQLVTAALPCYVHTTTNTDDANGRVAQLKNDNQFTYDRLSCEAGSDVKGQDWVLWGSTWYKVVGDPKVRVGSSVRTANRQQVFLTVTNAPPLFRDYFEVIQGATYPDALAKLEKVDGQAESPLELGFEIDRDLYVGGQAWLNWSGQCDDQVVTVTGLDQDGEAETWTGTIERPELGPVLTEGEVQLTPSTAGSLITEVTNVSQVGVLDFYTYYIESREP